MVANTKPSYITLNSYFRDEDTAELKYEVAAGLHSTLHLAAIACDLRLADVYARVIFPPASASEITE